MKVVRYYEYGDRTVLRYEDAERPSPAAGQVLVQVAGSAFNPVDAAIRAGYLQGVFPVRFPHVPGFDISGTVAAVGSGVTGFELGQAVVGFLPMHEDGAAAEYVLAPADALASAPTSIPPAEASALPSAGLTAWQACSTRPVCNRVSASSSTVPADPSAASRCNSPNKPAPM